MTILDVSTLEFTNKVEDNDFIHDLSKGMLDNWLSYKSQAKYLSSVFASGAEIRTLQDKINALSADFLALSAKFITKKETNDTYVSKETLNNKTPALLKYDSMEELTANYVTNSDAGEKAADCRKEANRLADEMTDFLAAAAVGAAATGGGAAPVEPVEGGSGDGESGGSSGSGGNFVDPLYPNGFSGQG